MLQRIQGKVHFFILIHKSINMIQKLVFAHPRAVIIYIITNAKTDPKGKTAVKIIII